MPSDNFVPNNVWASNTPTTTGEELTTPTGQTCLARKFSVPDLIKAGIFTQADSLTPLVQQAATGKTDIDMSVMLSDPNALDAIMRVADKAVPHIVLSPKVVLHFKDVTVGKTTVTQDLTEEERAAIIEAHPGAVFTDQIDFEDRMWLFEWATGNMGKMQSFRNRSATGVAGVAHGPKHGGKTKRSARKTR